MKDKLTKGSFTQVDSQWMFATEGFHLNLSRNEHGEFRLTVYGSVEPLPPETAYPTEPEWDRALKLANRFLDAYRIATRRNQSP
jgi:hypothetical protein